VLQQRGGDMSPNPQTTQIAMTNTPTYDERPERPRRIADAKAILLGPRDRA
jgi:hypothetical protein